MSSAVDIPVNKRAKQLQLAAGGLLVIAVFLVAYAMTGKDSAPKAKPITAPEITTTAMLAGGQTISDRERWIATAGQTMDAQKQEINDLKKTSADAVTRLEELSKKIEQNQKSNLALPLPQQQLFVPSSPVPVLPDVNQSTALSRQAPVLPFAVNRLESVADRDDAESKINRVVRRVEPASSNPLVASSAAQSGAQSAEVKIAAKRIAGENYLPIGFVRARILGGLDAPTSGQAQSEPLPLFLEVIDTAQLPNSIRLNMRKCLMIGQAWGDISSERAYARISTISCINKDGSVVEIKARANVFGEDGKYGLRGRLVSKQGQMLANALFSGVVAGIGQGIQFKSTSTSVNPLGGSVTTPNSGQSFEAGLGGGVAKALDRLANYYVDLANKTFPVIEIESGRIVDVAFSAGVELDTPIAIGGDVKRINKRDLSNAEE